MNLNDYSVNKIEDIEDGISIELVKDGVVVTTGRYYDNNICFLDPVPAIDEDEFELVQAIEQGTLLISE